MKTKRRAWVVAFWGCTILVLNLAIVSCETEADGRRIRTRAEISEIPRDAVAIRIDFEKTTAQDLVSIATRAPGIKSVHLIKSVVTDEVMLGFSSFGKIETLRLNHCPAISNRSLELIARLPRIRNVVMNNNRIVSDEGLELLTSSSTLRYVSLGNFSGITYDGLARLDSSLKRCEVEALRVDYMDVDDEYANGTVTYFDRSQR